MAEQRSWPDGAILEDVLFSGERGDVIRRAVFTKKGNAGLERLIPKGDTEALKQFREEADQIIIATGTCNG